MASAAAGVVGAVQVNGPLANQPTKLNDPSSGGYWVAVWVLVAIVILFLVV